MRNAFQMTVAGTILTITIDAPKEFGRSALGKTVIAAATDGNVAVPSFCSPGRPIRVSDPGITDALHSLLASPRISEVRLRDGEHEPRPADVPSGALAAQARVGAGHPSP